MLNLLRLSHTRRIQLAFLLQLAIGLLSSNLKLVNHPLTANSQLSAPINWPIATQSNFQVVQQAKEQTIPYATVTQSDPTRDACLPEMIIKPGVPGKVKRVIQLTYFGDQLFDQQEIAQHYQPPVDQIVVKGTAKVVKTTQVAGQTIRYLCDLGNFVATAYDARCPGCSSTTATGMAAGFGVVAVDPQVIPLGSKLYISGYGQAVAGDVGGSIKGKRIDLGFETASKNFGRRQVQVWLLP